jgi:Fe2+ or Zn2+ uptake regulation protein
MMPIKSEIMEIITRQSNLTDTELYNSVQKKYSWLNLKEFNRELMELEILGLIHVFQIGKDKRRIELVSGQASFSGEFDF